MEFDLIPQLIIIISVGIIIIILSRNISKVDSLNEKKLLFEKEGKTREREKFFYLYKRISGRISKKKYQESVNLMWVWLEKTLRKIRISFLKIDNKIISLLAKLKEKHKEIGIDKNKENYSINNYKNREKQENKIDEKEKINFENELQKNKILENRDDNKMAKDANENENKEKIIDNISGKENTKGKERIYIEMILKNPIDIKTYWKLGVMYSRRKNYKDAVSCFRQITKIDPTYKKAKKKISNLMEKMKEKKKL